VSELHPEVKIDIWQTILKTDGQSKLLNPAKLQLEKASLYATLRFNLDKHWLIIIGVCHG